MNEPNKTFPGRVICRHCKSDFTTQQILDLGVPLKKWMLKEAKEKGIGITGIWQRLNRSPEKYYPNIQVTRINQRVVFVKQL